MISVPGFLEKDGKAYCTEDFYRLFSPRCAGCERSVRQNYLSAANGTWHPECFVCAVSLPTSRPHTRFSDSHTRRKSGTRTEGKHPHICFIRNIRPTRLIETVCLTSMLRFEMMQINQGEPEFSARRSFTSSANILV